MHAVMRGQTSLCAPTGLAPPVWMRRSLNVMTLPPSLGPWQQSASHLLHAHTCLGVMHQRRGASRRTQGLYACKHATTRHTLTPTHKCTCSQSAPAASTTPTITNAAACNPLAPGTQVDQAAFPFLHPNTLDPHHQPQPQPQQPPFSSPTFQLPMSGDAAAGAAIASTPSGKLAGATDLGFGFLGECCSAAVLLCARILDDWCRGERVWIPCPMRRGEGGSPAP